MVSGERSKKRVPNGDKKATSDKAQIDDAVERDPVVDKALNHDFGYPVGTYGYGPNGRSDHSDVDQDTAGEANASQRGGFDGRKVSQGEMADDDAVAEGSEESFPASDPPSWIGGRG